jgi:uncharacterized membrane protein
MSEEVQTPVEITDDDKLWSLLSWIFAPLISIIVLLLEDKKNRPFIKYNAMQSLLVGGVSLLVSFTGIGCIVSLALLVYQIYLGIQAYNGETVTVPLVTDFCKKQGWI